jgi:esterase/lipase superfamily enzyme
MTDQTPVQRALANRETLEEMDSDELLEVSYELIDLLEEHLAYERYVIECEVECCNPHTFEMWQIHGRMEGPI